MSTLTITDVERVRARGGLSTDESAGAPTVAQIQAAIINAQRKMLFHLTHAIYDPVQIYTQASPVVALDQEKYDAFDFAESYFALADLLSIMTNQQLGASGMVQSTTVGQGTQSFISADERTKLERKWEAKAYRELAPYVSDLLTHTEEDGDVKKTGVTSADKRFSFMAI